MSFNESKISSDQPLNGSEIKKPKMANELTMFDDVFPSIINDLEKLSVLDPETTEAVDWFRKVSLGFISLTNF